MRKLRSIQVLRAVAALGVVALHAYGYQRADHLRLGAAGVDLFFVISGFIMAHVSQGKTAREFLTDRCWRIYPIWFVAVLPWLIAYHSAWPTTLASLTLWPIYSHFTTPALLVGWTLSFEMLFYVSFAIALKTRAWVPLSLFFCALILGQMARVPLFDYLGNPMIFEFLFGVAIARLPQHFALPAIILAVLGFAISPLWVFDSGVATSAATSGVRVLVWGVPAALLVYGVLQLESLFSSKAFNLPVLLGDASYSIYLFHALVVRVVHLNWIAEFLLSAATGVAIFMLLERRLIAIRRRRAVAASREGAPYRAAASYGIP